LLLELFAEVIQFSSYFQSIPTSYRCQPLFTKKTKRDDHHHVRWDKASGRSLRP
jgi:hypothetical protein